MWLIYFQAIVPLTEFRLISCITIIRASLVYASQLPSFARYEIKASLVAALFLFKVKLTGLAS